ncbi:5-formyltetrahydrofolate cyclo-ligase [Haloferula sargassicola]|uniref:5-formyltetrahydrofolate cyclo-ligase n=1 Tax=Haloferula sargassicola TaxID=490096 RepID=A0ABP9UH00_9BACT
MQATTPGPHADKTQWRAWLRRQFDPRPQETSRLLADALLRRLDQLPAGRVALFSPLHDEPDLTPLVVRGPHQWYLPRVEDHELRFHHVRSIDDLTSGAFGIREPDPHSPVIDPASLDVIVCPGLGFGRDGSRLGRGRGFYDRALSLARNARLIGAAFPCRLVDSLPVEAHDIPMHHILDLG